MNQKSFKGLAVLVIGFFLLQNLRKGSVEGSSNVIPDEVIPERPSPTPLEKPIQKPPVIIPPVEKRTEEPRIYVNPKSITIDEYIAPPNPIEEYYSQEGGEILPDRDFIIPKSSTLKPLNPTEEIEEKEGIAIRGYGYGGGGLADM